jgi:hypothetical protein
MAIRFELDAAGLRDYLRTDPDLRATLERAVQDGAQYAQSIAPVGQPGEGGAYSSEHREPGAYQKSLRGVVHVGPSRMSGRIESDDFKAHWIEYGAAHTPKSRVLGRALEQIHFEE